MKKFLIDVPVLLIFFNRPSILAKTFASIKEARPSKLFLYQDGPRKNRKDDLDNIAKCREIVANVDWECEIFTNYQVKNNGCDPSEFIAIKWAFSIVDKCIIIEDDDVADVTFFRFCKELLDKYEGDDRICRISGMNHLGKYKSSSLSYFFTSSGSIWGWATWKRVVDNWDETYRFLSDNSKKKQLKKTCKELKVDYKAFISTCLRHKATGKEHYESIFYSYRLLTNTLTIVPSLNLISNIGLTDDSTHSTSNVKLLPKGIRRVFNMETYSMIFPMSHLETISNDLEYVKLVNKIMGSTPFRRFWRRVEAKIRQIIYKK